MSKHNHKISTSFVRNNERYNRLSTAVWISILTILLSADWLKYEREIIWNVTGAKTHKEVQQNKGIKLACCNVYSSLDMLK